MNKILRKKFVFSSMMAISILLILIIGTINIVNLINTNNMAWKSLDMISSFSDQAETAPEGRPEKPEEPDNRPEQEPPGQMGRNAYDTYMASNFFVVEYSGQGDVEKVDVSRTSRYTEDEAIEMAERAVASEKTEGRDGKCIFMKKEKADKSGSSVVFLDMSYNTRTVLSVLVVSLLVGAASWLLMLLITLLVSRKATKPIAESFEKQKQFITDAGHEYKTPLAIIQSNADAVELHVGENKWLTNIKQQVSRLTVMTQDMLLLAKIDEGNPEKEKTLVNVSERTNLILAAFEQEMEQKGTEIVRAVEENVFVKCIQEDADKVFGILLDNALKYGKPEGSIAVKLKEYGNGMQFIIENDCDELPGVPPEKLFERFFRPDKSRSREMGGSGIGLSIAKAIVESYGGTIKGEYLDNNVIRFTVEM